MEFRGNSMRRGSPAKRRQPKSKLRYVESGLDLDSILTSFNPFFPSESWIGNPVEVEPRRVLRSHSRGRNMERSCQQNNSTVTVDSALRKRQESPSPSPTVKRRPRGRSLKRSATKRRWLSRSPPKAMSAGRVLRSGSKARVTEQPRKKIGNNLWVVRTGNQDRGFDSANQIVDIKRSKLQSPGPNQKRKTKPANISSYDNMSVARRLKPSSVATPIPFGKENCDKSLEEVDSSSDSSEEQIEMAVDVMTPNDESVASPAPNCSANANITGTESSTESILIPTTTDEEVCHETSSSDDPSEPSLEDENDCPRSPKRSWGSMCRIA